MNYINSKCILKVLYWLQNLQEAKHIFHYQQKPKWLFARRAELAREREKIDAGAYPLANHETRIVSVTTMLKD
jgi:hypothetical protein